MSLHLDKTATVRLPEGLSLSPAPPGAEADKRVTVVVQSNLDEPPKPTKSFLQHRVLELFTGNPDVIEEEQDSEEEDSPRSDDSKENSPRESSSREQEIQEKATPEAPVVKESAKKADRGWRIFSGIASSFIQRFAKDFHPKEKIKSAKEKMLKALDDPLYIEFQDFIVDLLVQKNNIDKIYEYLASNKDLAFLLEEIEEAEEVCPNLIENIIRVNIANGFVNLAECINNNRSKIPNYENQSSLVNILSYFAQQMRNNIPTERLEEIEQERRRINEEKAKIYDSLKKVYDFSKDQELSSVLALEDVSKLDHKQVRSRFSQLLKRPLIPQEYQEIESGLTQLKSHALLLDKFNKELLNIFMIVGDQILNVLFPKQLKSIDAPGTTAANNVFARAGQNLFMGASLYQKLRAVLSGFLLKNYDPLRKNLVRLDGWQQDIQRCVGDKNIDSLLKAPSDLLSNILKSYINESPDALSKVEWALAMAADEQQGKRALTQLSRRQLAGWILNTLQTMLNTTNPDLLAAGGVIKDAIQTLTLGLVAKGARFAIPAGQAVKEEQFMQVLIERLTSKFKEITDEFEMTEDSWTAFLNNLPLPPFVKKLALVQLLEKSKGLKVVKQTKQAYQEALAKLESYQEREKEQLLKIVDSIANTILSLSKEQGSSVLSSMNHFVDDLLGKYLPGLKIDKDLKKWFKSNVEILNFSEAIDTSMNIVKMGLKTIILKSFTNMLDVGQQHNENFLAPIFSYLEKAFKQSFAKLDKKDKKALKEAGPILTVVKQLAAERDELTKEYHERKGKLLEGNGLDPAERDSLILQMHLLEKLKDLFQSQKLLTSKIDKILEALNKGKEKKWDEKKIDATARLIRELKVQQLKASKDLRNVSAKDAETLYLELQELTHEEITLIKEGMSLRENLQQISSEFEKVEKEFKQEEETSFERLAKKAEDSSEEHHVDPSTIGAWQEAQNEKILILSLKSDIYILDDRISEAEEQLDSKLLSFKALSQELMAIMGLGSEDNLHPTLKNQVWPLLKSFKNKKMARLLFEYVYPWMKLVIEKSDKKKKLQQATGSSLLGSICQVTSKQIVEKVLPSAFGYRTAAKDVLTLMKTECSPELVEQLSQEFAVKVVELGRAALTHNHLIELFNDLNLKFDSETREVLCEKLLFSFYSNQLNLEAAERLFSCKLTPKIVNALNQGLNNLLEDLGKKNLGAKDLFVVYQKVVPADKQAQGITEEEAVVQIEAQKIVQKVQDALMSPKAISEQFKEFVPETVDVNRFVLPQFEELLVSSEEIFKGNRDNLKDLIESALVDVSERFAGKKGDYEILQRLVKALKEGSKRICSDPRNQKLLRRCSNKIILSFLKELGITKEKYNETIVDQCSRRLTPIILPLLLKDTNKVLLTQFSRTSFLATLSKALSQDCVTFLSQMVSVEKVTELLGKFDIPDDIRQQIVARLNSFLHGDHGAYANATLFMKEFCESAFLILFGKIAAKNPSQPGKDSVIVLAENLVNIVVKHYLEAIARLNKGEQQAAVYADFASHLNDDIMKNLLGFESVQDLKDLGLPDPLPGMIYPLIKDLIAKFVLLIQEKLLCVEPDSQGVEQAKQRLFVLFGERWAEAIAQDAGKMAVTSTLHVMNEVVGDQPKGVTITAESTVNYLESLARKNFEVAKALLKYKGSPIFKAFFGICLNKFKNSPDLSLEREKVADRIGNVLLLIIDYGFSYLKRKEQQRGAEFNISLMTNIMNAVANHFENINKAKRQAATRGDKTFSHQDFVQAAEDRLHPATPVAIPNFNGCLKIIEKRLGYIQVNERPVRDQKEWSQLSAEEKGVWVRNALTRLVNANGRLKKEIFRLGRLNEDQRTALIIGITALEVDDAIKIKLREAVNAWVRKPKVEAGAEAFVYTQDHRRQIRELLQKMVYEDQTSLRPIREEGLIKKLEQIVGPLTRVQKAQLRRPNEEGLTLKDLIRKEADLNKNNKTDHFYKPESEALFSQFNLPITDGLAGEIVKGNLVPMVLPLITELLLDRDIITEMVISSLETTKETLSGKIVLEPEVPFAFGPLDDAFGRVVCQMVDFSKLPKKIADMIRDPQTGQINEVMRKSMGGVLRKQFNDTYSTRMLSLVMKKFSGVPGAKPGEPRKPGFDYDTRPQVVKDREKLQRRQANEKKLKQSLCDVVDVGIHYYIRNKWTQYQAAMDAWIYATFGKVGAGLKKALDLAFRFIFFTVIGSILYILSLPIKPILKKAIYRMVRLDENRELLMNLLRVAPKDQPANDSYVACHEDLIYNAAKAIEDAFNPPVVEGVAG